MDGIEWAREYHEHMNQSREVKYNSVEFWKAMLETEQARTNALREITKDYETALKKIVAMPNEDDEWHGRDMFHDARDIAFRALYEEPE